MYLNLYSLLDDGLERVRADGALQAFALLAEINVVLALLQQRQILEEHRLVLGVAVGAHRLAHCRKKSGPISISLTLVRIVQLGRPASHLCDITSCNSSNIRPTIAQA